MAKPFRQRLKRSIEKRIAAMRRQSFAHNELDLLLAPILKRKRGFFVEAGANDGIKQSNTLYFEKYLAWKGILVEPIPDLARQCRSNRPQCRVEECALVAAGGPKELDLQVAGLMSVAEGAFDGHEALTVEQHLEWAREHQLLKPGPVQTVRCPTRTLSDILEAHGSPEVDLLSLDVEGYEEQALMGLDLERHRPRFILVEQRDPARVADLLAPHYVLDRVLAENPYYQDGLYRLIA